MAKRIFITGFWHETNTFAQTKTDMDAFRAYLYAEGGAIIDDNGDTLNVTA